MFILKILSPFLADYELLEVKSQHALSQLDPRTDFARNKVSAQGSPQLKEVCWKCLGHRQGLPLEDLGGAGLVNVDQRAHRVCLCPGKQGPDPQCTVLVLGTKIPPGASHETPLCRRQEVDEQ